MTTRPFPAWDYRVPDKDDTRVQDLEAALMESNDTAARLRHIALGVIGANYNLDQEHAERFLTEWVTDASAWPVRGIDFAAAGLAEYRWAGINSRADSMSVAALEADGWTVEHVDPRYGTRLMRRAAP
jgi:hypothetical protein